MDEADSQAVWDSEGEPGEDVAAAWASERPNAAVVPMETQRISPECRANRTVSGAWDEAVRRLREVYDAQVEHDPTITLRLTIGRAYPPGSPAVPVPESDQGGGIDD